MWKDKVKDKLLKVYRTICLYIGGWLVYAGEWLKRAGGEVKEVVGVVGEAEVIGEVKEETEVKEKVAGHKAKVRVKIGSKRDEVDVTGEGETKKKVESWMKAYIYAKEMGFSDEDAESFQKMKGGVGARREKIEQLARIRGLRG